MNFYSHFPHLLTDLVEIWCNFPHKAIDLNFHGDRTTEGRALLREQIKLFSILHILFPIWVQFTKGGVHRTVLRLAQSKTCFSQQHK